MPRMQPFEYRLYQCDGMSAGAGGPEAHAVGAKGTVTLDARFDAGYFVTVHVGSQEFKGMLYYPPPEPVEVGGPSKLPHSGLISTMVNRVDYHMVATACTRAAEPRHACHLGPTPKLLAFLGIIPAALMEPAESQRLAPENLFSCQRSKPRGHRAANVV